jgi:hypothetical protein
MGAELYTSFYLTMQHPSITKVLLVVAVKAEREYGARPVHTPHEQAALLAPGPTKIIYEVGVKTTLISGRVQKGL